MESSKTSIFIVLVTTAALTAAFGILHTPSSLEYDGAINPDELVATAINFSPNEEPLMSLVPPFELLFGETVLVITEWEPIFCTKEFEPVCGEDGNIYPNTCIATEFYNVNVAYLGKCKAETIQDISVSISTESVIEEITESSIVEEVLPPPPLVEVVVSPPPAPPPELQLKAFYHYNSSLVETDPIDFAVSVTNVGDERNATGTVFFIFDKNNDGVETLPLAERTIYPLIPKETKTVTWKNALLPTPGTHKATACLSIEGESQTKQCKSIVFTVIPQASDLVVSIISILPENSIAGDIITIRAVIKNQGKGNASHALTSLRIDAQNNSSWDFVANKLPLNNLGGGETTTLEWTAVWRTVKGFNRIEVCTDTEGELTEKDVRNNCKLSTFSVQPGTYTGANSVTFSIKDGLVSPESQSVVPGGIIIFANRDFESYFIRGDLGSFYVELETETSTVAPLYTGVYTFYTLDGIELNGTVVVE